MEKIFEAMEMLLSMDKELFHIIGVTLRMSFFSTLISCLIGLPLGVVIENGRFRGRSLIKKTAGTLMGLPPVVAGLIVYMLFTKYRICSLNSIFFTCETISLMSVSVFRIKSVRRFGSRTIISARAIDTHVVLYEPRCA